MSKSSLVFEVSSTQYNARIIMLSKQPPAVVHLEQGKISDCHLPKVVFPVPSSDISLIGSNFKG